MIQIFKLRCVCIEIALAVWDCSFSSLYCFLSGRSLSCCTPVRTTSCQSWTWVGRKLAWNDSRSVMLGGNLCQVFVLQILNGVGRGMSEYPSMKHHSSHGFIPNPACYLPLTTTHAGERTWQRNSHQFLVQQNTGEGRKTAAFEWIKAPAKKLCLGTTISSFVHELPLMSTAAGSAGYPVGQSYDKDHGMINLDVRTLTGGEEL